MMKRLAYLYTVSGNISSIAEFSKVLSFIVLSLNVIRCEYFAIPRDSNNQYLRKLTNSNCNQLAF